MKVYEVERFLEEREIDRNSRISKALKGSMKPSDAAIIKILKEKQYERSGEIEQ